MSLATQKEIEQAAQTLRAGGLVAFATETVYGLGADATNTQAVAKIFAAKGRPSGNPLIVHVADIPLAQRFTAAWPDSADALARTFWPGPLTLVLPKSPAIVTAVTAGLATVAVRCPDNEIALKLLREFAGPIAAPSANRSNRVSPTTAEHVRRELGDRVQMILDGGPCKVGIESTVIDLASPIPAVLRPGAITQRQIEQVIGKIELRTVSVHPSRAAASPGQQPVHYSPATPAFRFDEADWPRMREFFAAQLGRRKVFLIIAGSSLAEQLRKELDGGEILEMPSGPEDYARQLYAALHRADDLHAGMIWVQLPPAEPAWAAITDRLVRATRPASQAFG